MYWDEFTKTCYNGYSCPLPIPGNWMNVSYCPKCTQTICLSCESTNRSNCFFCGENSTLVDGQCVCNSGYW